MSEFEVFGDNSLVINWLNGEMQLHCFFGGSGRAA